MIITIIPSSTCQPNRQVGDFHDVGVRLLVGGSGGLAGDILEHLNGAFIGLGFRLFIDIDNRAAGPQFGRQFLLDHGIAHVGFQARERFVPTPAFFP